MTRKRKRHLLCNVNTEHILQYFVVHFLWEFTEGTDIFYITLYDLPCLEVYRKRKFMLYQRAPWGAIYSII